MSAQANLAGMFPPTEQQEWKYNLNWHPIPVHTTSKREEYLFGPYKQCDRCDYLMLKDVINSTYYQTLFYKNRSLIKHLEINAGKRLTSLKDLFFLYETLLIEQTKGRS